jgi:hypothetical protein
VDVGAGRKTSRADEADHMLLSEAKIGVRRM